MFPCAREVAHTHTHTHTRLHRTNRCSNASVPGLVAESYTCGAGSEGHPAPDGKAGACHCFTLAASLPDALAPALLSAVHGSMLT